MRERQMELLKQAQREHLAQMAQQPKENWLKNLFQREAHKPTIALSTSASPELG